MPMPVRHLPVLQNWDCHTCGQCCKEYTINITPAEKDRIEGQGWASLPEFAGIPLVVRDGWGNRYRLNHRADGGCVFLDEAGRCRIHAKFGGTQKPLACQVYPYVFIPAGHQWRVGVRYACPSATANKGRSVSLQRAELQRYAAELEEREGVLARSPKPAELRRGQRLDWDDIERLARALTQIIAATDRPIEYRWRWALAVAGLCRPANFGEVRGGRLKQFLEVVSQGVASDVPDDTATVAPPTAIGRVLFRLLAAVYVRRDSGPRRGTAQAGRLALLVAATRFARGRGGLPRLHGSLPDVTFEDLERPAGPLPPAAEELLTRYYRTKIESYQFFGPTHFHYGFWDGLDALALTLPVTLWLARAYRDRPRTNAIELALQIVDDNFGYNPLLGRPRLRWATRQLGRRAEISRLIARYAN
jgi:lysine-N-methylase